MQRSGDQPRREKDLVRQAILLVPTDRLDAIVTYAPFRSSARVNSLRDRRGLSCASKNPKSMGLQWQLCFREDHDSHLC